MQFNRRAAESNPYGVLDLWLDYNVGWEPVRGNAGYVELMRTGWNAIDIRMQPDEVLATSDRVLAHRLRWVGTGDAGWLNSPAFLIIGFVAATFGAALETTLSAGYTISQYFGWQWGKFVRPVDASRFHAVMLLSLVLGTMLILMNIEATFRASVGMMRWRLKFMTLGIAVMSILPTAAFMPPRPPQNFTTPLAI